MAGTSPAMTEGCLKFELPTLVSRARCGILHAASQNRDPGWSSKTGTPALQRTAPQVLRHSASKTRLNALMALRPGSACPLCAKEVKTPQFLP